MTRPAALVLLVALGPSCHPLPDPAPAPEAPGTVAIRVNQLGLLPDAPKIAVVCALGGGGPTPSAPSM